MVSVPACAGALMDNTLALCFGLTRTLVRVFHLPPARSCSAISAPTSFAVPVTRTVSVLSAVIVAGNFAAKCGVLLLADDGEDCPASFGPVKAEQNNAGDKHHTNESHDVVWP